MSINWYPGHMAKAKREIEKAIRLADLVVEVLDARAPAATMNPDIEKITKGKPRVIVLNKADAADSSKTIMWLNHFREKGHITVEYSALVPGRTNLKKTIFQAAYEIIKKWESKGVKKTVRVMVLGIPNVGKSSIINRLSSSAKAKTGAKPGVTRAGQWIKIGPYLDLMDTPGILWPKLSDKKGAKRLAYINAIRDEVLDGYQLALSFADEIKRISPVSIKNRYGFDCADLTSEEILTCIAKRFGFILKGVEYDIERAGVTLIDDFRAGRLGRITLEIPDDYTDSRSANEAD